ncbi:hypothetical protein LOD99_12601 [Oopsacas minuta]|uniref:Tudor domain-containing protein n=1 Tax=Oopsacas minuta TaxID=111878 RepID=A0AAV7JCN8_9METZ|nr:hypothetical protein LOD99_12601 [Oopsacas minuta]
MDSSYWKIELDSTIFMKLATFLNQNGTFWGLQQHTQEFRMEIFDHLFEQLQIYAETPNSQTKQSFKVGSLCAAQFYLDKKWYRALVECLEEEKGARVRFLDYGNSQLTQLGHLLHLPPQFCQLPFQAILCSMNFTADVTLTKPRREKFSELLEEEGAKHFSCLVKRIEGPIHFVNISKTTPNNSDTKLDVNEEVFLSDLHVPDMELTNKSWADAMKSPSSPENTHPFPSSSAGAERTHPVFKQQPEHSEEFNEKRHEQSGRPSDYSGAPTRHAYPNRIQSRDQDNDFQREGRYQHQQQNRYQSYQDRYNRGQGGQSWRTNDSWKGDYPRSRGPAGQYTCLPSLYLKCEYFSNHPPSVVNKTMVDILKDFHDNVTNIVPDTRSGSPIVFIDVDTHENAMEVIYYLKGQVGHIDGYEIHAELAKRYKQFLESQSMSK